MKKEKRISSILLIQLKSSTMTASPSIHPSHSLSANTERRRHSTFSFSFPLSLTSINSNSSTPSHADLISTIKQPSRPSIPSQVVND